MKKYSTLLVVLICCFIAGCADSDKESQLEKTKVVDSSMTTSSTIENAEKKLINVELSIQTLVQTDNTVLVNGTTNLPDGMHLMLNLKSDSSSYFAQDNVNVSSGSFQAGPFSDRGNGLAAGTYNLVVTSSTANVQPSEVKKIIGDNGLFLSGHNIKSDSVWGNTVYITKDFTITTIQSDTNTSEELENDFKTPSTNVNDYNSNGEYKPVEEMTQEEIRAELEAIIGDFLGE